MCELTFYNKTVCFVVFHSVLIKVSYVEHSIQLIIKKRYFVKCNDNFNLKVLFLKKSS